MAKTHEGWFINSPKRKVRFVVRRRRRRRAAHNPVGESLVVLGLGGNPRRRKARRRRKLMARRRMSALQRKYFGPRRRRRRRVYHDNARRRVYHRRVSHAERPRRRRRRVYHDNAGHHRVHRYRRNVAGAGAASIRLDRPAQWMPLALSAGAGAATAAAVPRLIVGPAVTTWTAYAIEAGVGFAGAFLLPMVGLRRMTAFAFALGAFGYTVGDIIGRYAFRALGLSAYTFEGTASLADMGQEPRYPPSLSAYAYETTGDADVVETETVSDMPYEAAYSTQAYGAVAPGAPWEVH